MDVDAEHAAAGSTTMASVSSRLSALCAKIDDLSTSGTDTMVWRVGFSCICIALYNLGNAVPRPGSTRRPLVLSTAEFEEESVLGSDYKGYVVKVRHRVTGKSFALKTLRPMPPQHEGEPEEEDDEEEALLALDVLREACFMAACRGHPSLVRFHAVGRHPGTGRYCLVMEHVGPSLDDVLVNQRGCEPFPEHEVRRITRQVLEGAKAMHERRFVHRTIHPHNILVGVDGGDFVKIGNFGEATSMSEADVLYDTRLSYVAPEVLLKATGGDNREVIDSWSIGCLMAELLTGEDLFEVMVDGDVEGQLYRIFDVLGVPGKRTMQAIKPRNLGLSEEVKQWGARQRRVGKQRNRNMLRKLVPDAVLSDDGFEVLQGLLECNPKKRLTAAAALELPWFTDNDDSSAVTIPQVDGPVMKPLPFSSVLIGLLALPLFIVFAYVGSRY